MQDREVVIGLAGLQSAAWAEDFFPEDIPEDWRFSFLTNEIRALLLTQEDEPGVPDDCEDWADEVDEEFCLIHTPGDVLANLASRFQEAGASTVLIESDQALWRPDNRVRHAQVGLVDLASDPSPAQMRQWVEMLVEDSPDQQQLFLLFDGKAAAYAVREARMLVELMGF